MAEDDGRKRLYCSAGSGTDCFSCADEDIVLNLLIRRSTFAESFWDLLETKDGGVIADFFWKMLYHKPGGEVLLFSSVRMYCWKKV